MAKTQVKFCSKCDNYQRHTYIGKPAESQEEKSFNFVATLMTLGAYQIPKRLFDDRPKFWECNKCGYISKA
jgi:hypothetical protein